MKVLVLPVLLVLLVLEGVCCHDNRNAKATGKSTKKAGGSLAAGAGDATAGGTGSLRGTSGGSGGSRAALGSGNGRSGGVSGGTGGSRGAGGSGGGGGRSGQEKAAAPPPDDMRLHFLQSSQVTCNDGTAAGFYLKEFRGSRRWIVFLEGGWCCYSLETCRSRYQNVPRLMSSSGWPPTRRGSGILSSQAEENPHWYNANIVFVPYCSSDVWSGGGPALTPPTRPRLAKEKEREPDANATEFTFMGALILQEVIKDLVPKGIKQAKVVMLSGTSAGATGVLLNIERVAAQLQRLGAEAQVRGLVDSGWFLESKRPPSPNCAETTSCSPVDAIRVGLRLWNGVVPDGCGRLYQKGEEWQCFFGHKLYSTLTSPLFIVQWLFDEEQLKVENIHLGARSLSEEQWLYVQNLGAEIKNSLRDVTAAFAPSCLSHMAITRSTWAGLQVKGTSLPRALHCWDRSLEARRNNKRPPARGCPFHLLDACQLPQCNPTCPPLLDRATQQVLLHLGLDPQGEADQQAGVLSDGG